MVEGDQGFESPFLQRRVSSEPSGRDLARAPKLLASARQASPARTRKCWTLSPPAEGICNREHDELGDRDALHQQQRAISAENAERAFGLARPV